MIRRFAWQDPVTSRFLEYLQSKLVFRVCPACWNLRDTALRTALQQSNISTTCWVQQVRSRCCCRRSCRGTVSLGTPDHQLGQVTATHVRSRIWRHIGSQGTFFKRRMRWISLQPGFFSFSSAFSFGRLPPPVPSTDLCRCFEVGKQSLHFKRVHFLVDLPRCTYSCYLLFSMLLLHICGLWTTVWHLGTFQ